MQLNHLHSGEVRSKAYQTGFGLVELLIGTAIALIILAAASTVLLSSLTSNRDSIRMARLDQELRQVMTMISRDLHRATAWDPAVDVARLGVDTDPDAAPNPRLILSASSGTGVTVSGMDLDLSGIGAKAVGGTLVYVSGSTAYKASINSYDSGAKTYSVSLTGTWPATSIPAGTWTVLRPATNIDTDAVAGTPGTCILFAYDTDANGVYAGNEYFGYRYDATDAAVEIRTSGAASDTCANGAGTWENLTDNLSIEITGFTITENSPAAVSSSGMSVGVREFTVTITGRLKSDTSVVRTLQETIRVRNEQLS